MAADPSDETVNTAATHRIEVLGDATPEQVAANPGSHTGRFLEELVEPEVTRTAKRSRKREPVAA